MQQKPSEIIRSILLPILAAIYPVVFLYSYNVKIDEASSMITPLVGITLLALVLFGIFFLFQRKVSTAALSVCAFLVLFNTYGFIYAKLLVIDIVQVEHYTLLPLLVLIGFYLGIFISKLNLKAAQGLVNILLIVVAVLVVYNIAAAIPAEFEKNKASLAAKPVQAANVKGSENYPDIYFLIFDEYAGFDAIKEYWKYNEITKFEDSLRAKGFFIAEHSHSRTFRTLNEIASRLNLRPYTNKAETAADYKQMFDAIADNKVMQIVKSYGYTTVVFDGTAIPYSTKTPIIADYNLKYNAAETKSTISTDQFSALYLGQTMVLAIPSIYNSELTGDDENKGMILYTLDKTADLKDIPSPKFVYMHVMLPHMPIGFDQNGSINDMKHRVDWTYYLGQHIYATKRADELVTKILQNADPKRPPVIVLQSDHGARNILPSNLQDAKFLKNYDNKYRTSIMNALYLPGFDTSTLTQDMDPIYTFEIILNHYLNANVKVDLAEDGQ